MLDLNKKYWYEFGPICVKCSIEEAVVVLNVNTHPIVSLNISEESKAIIKLQIEEGIIPTAYPDKPETIKAIQELESLNYTVFYWLDEPIGHGVSEDLLEKDEEPEITLNEIRKKQIEFIVRSWVKYGSDEKTVREDMPKYKDKEFGKDWFLIPKTDNDILGDF